MINRKTGSLAAIITAALIVAGCGSSSNSSSSSAGASSSPSSSASSGGGVKISTAHGSDGTYLTGSSGRAIYLWVADTGDKSSCSGACASTWPPVTPSAQPVA